MNKKTKTPLPNELQQVVDFSPLNDLHTFLLLLENGQLVRFDADSETWNPLLTISLPQEKGVWNRIRKHLHVSPNERYAAVVNDYGQYGQVVDLQTEKPLFSLKNDGHHANHVPFSFAFIERQGETIAIHRTECTKLAQINLSTAKKEREEGGDPFHGALVPNPSGTRLALDNWVWHPMGLISIEDLQDPFEIYFPCEEREDWGFAITWIDDDRIAIEGIEHESEDMTDGARIFLLSDDSEEILTIVGPKGHFFCDGTHLFSSDASGFYRWSLADGAQTMHFPDFHPTRHNRNTGVFAEIKDGKLILWKN